MSKTTLSFDEEVKKRSESLVALRRDFHKFPELSFEEKRTHDVIAQRLRDAGLEVHTEVNKTGVVGILHGEKPGRTAAWRADIDALPLNEMVSLPFTSETSGVMHACGHDGHTAIAITMAEVMAAHRKELPGTAVFIFQPGEEVLGGAKGMIDAGVLEKPHVETVLGLHLSSMDPAGFVAASAGPTMASADFFEIEVRGKGGHGAFPHLSVDPITVAAHIIVGMQDLVSREIPASDTAVMTIGQVEGGTKNNIIPEVAYLRGSIRTFKKHIRDQLVERLASYASHTAAAHRAEASYHSSEEFCPAVESHVDIAGRVRAAAIAEIGKEAVIDATPIMGSDDMSLFLNERPGCYFRVGGQVTGAIFPHHHPQFQLDEVCLDVGLRVGLRSMLDSMV